jgi:hypothetical protein
VQCHILSKSLECFGIGYEISFAVHFYNHPQAPGVMRIYLDGAFIRHAPGFFDRLCQPFFAQIVSGGIQVAIMLLQRFFAIQRTYARHIAELFYHISRYLH